MYVFGASFFNGARVCVHAAGHLRPEKSTKKTVNAEFVLRTGRQGTGHWAIACEAACATLEAEEGERREASRTVGEEHGGIVARSMLRQECQMSGTAVRSASEGKHPKAGPVRECRAMCNAQQQARLTKARSARSHGKLQHYHHYQH